MDWKEWKYRLTLIIPLVVLFVLMIGAYVWVDYTMCEAKTANIGFPHNWGLFSGCMIEPIEGQWIPLENWRLFDE